MNTEKNARRNLIRNNRRASTKSLVVQGFKWVETTKVNFSHTTETWIHHDGTVAKIESLNLNLIRYIAAPVYPAAEAAAPVKAERTRKTYTLDQPIFYGSRLKRMLGEKGITADFNRHLQQWELRKGIKALPDMVMSVGQLTTLPGERVLARVDELCV